MRSNSEQIYRLTDVRHLGTSSPSSLTLTAGWQIIIDLGIESSFLVGRMNCIAPDCTIHLKTSSGFSRGAYQCRALAGMIHKASSTIARISSGLINCFVLRWDLFTEATKDRFRCKPAT